MARHWAESQQQRRLEDFQVTHLPLYCRLADDGNQGGIKTAKLNLFTVGGLRSASLCEKYGGKNTSILEIWEKEKKHLWLPAQSTNKYMANHPLCQGSAAGGVPHEATGRSWSKSLVNEAEWSPAPPSLYTEATPFGFCVFVSLTLPIGCAGCGAFFLRNVFWRTGHFLMLL